MEKDPINIQLKQIQNVVDIDDQWRQLARAELEQFASAHPQRHYGLHLFGSTIPMGVVCVIVIMGLIVPTSVLAEQSVPGEVLYPLKRIIEETHKTLTVNSEKKAVYTSELAIKRVNELKEISTNSQPNGDLGRSIDETTISVQEVSVIEQKEVKQTTLKAMEQKISEIEREVEEPTLQKSIATLKLTVENEINEIKVGNTVNSTKDSGQDKLITPKPDQTVIPTVELSPSVIPSPTLEELNNGVQKKNEQEEKVQGLHLELPIPVLKKLLP